MTLRASCREIKILWVSNSNWDIGIPLIFGSEFDILVHRNKDIWTPLTDFGYCSEETGMVCASQNAFLLSYKFQNWLDF